MNKSFLAFAASGLAVLSMTGCAATEQDENILQTSAYATALSCEANSGINPMKAALAVAMGEEMGRLHALRDLLVNANGLVDISYYGLSRCAGRGFTGCPNVRAILDLQKPEVNQYVPQTAFNVTAFREDLKSSFQRQLDHENNLAMNSPSRVPVEHTLTQIGTFTSAGACGIHYEFFAEGKNIVNLKERLVFFGEPTNDFLAFQSTSTTIAIDPTGTMNGDTTTSSLTCTAACTSTTASLKDTCCACNGVSGTFRPAPWNTRTLYCAY